MQSSLTSARALLLITWAGLTLPKALADKLDVPLVDP